ncbi:DSD1 family PLP-dependent enzyme [Idiomarina baltica]|uniref:DSD1 family PLP-dependent enzyme n=1 Tax=Idiomarina baltica TaxID=190892 RepID=UPI002352E397|nr:DSD1 family PLP-dependent enzyme [Idiomarina baltica]
MTWDALETPYLRVDRPRFDANIKRLNCHLSILKTPLRPHVKTLKSLPAVKAIFNGGTGPITVSTLKEADFFAEHGFFDQIYAVGIAQNKLPHVKRLIEQGVDLKIILESETQALQVVEFCRLHDIVIPVLIEIDCDGSRAGLTAESPALMDVSQILAQAQLFKGVLLHAGGSYGCTTRSEKVAAAENERATAVHVKERLELAGIDCPMVSIGSTPTAHFAQDLTGVTEVRAGVYTFFDLVMANINVCSLDDIALSVVTTVIGVKPEKGWILVDAGWMALSRDRGTASQAVDYGYGMVLDAVGRPLPDWIVESASQEHGVIKHRSGSSAIPTTVQVGDKLRILPNHACATASQFDKYYVADAEGQLSEQWSRFNFW